MKTFNFLRVVIVLLGILLSACSGVAAPDSGTGGSKPLASETVFTGVIESISGDQWVINGRAVKVDASVVRDGPFKAGDTVKVEARVEADGAIIALRIETPSAADLVTVNAPTPRSTPTGLPAGLVFDDSGKEAFGVVSARDGVSITVGGQTFAFAPGAEVKGQIVPGTFVKIHLTVASDGSLLVREVEPWDPAQVGNDNINGNTNANINTNTNSNSNNNRNDNSNGNTNSNDNDNDDNDNDNDNGNDDNSNDD